HDERVGAAGHTDDLGAGIAGRHHRRIELRHRLRLVVVIVVLLVLLILHVVLVLVRFLLVVG
ncbi:MAG TPA: hypothetical protein VFA42_07315, partial [Gaiellaceae bacterium]|nr:hypothetical protein [Gaiellaceae bacterium]